ncbi:hypothetical protein E2C01_028022 [Portunus trituberculatus]|uniref:Uncharacterized protein n=1 Tax=Portunus trituberculatus TaxID=210409 RepID=A0A5B7EN42_PORTR|nr:hypothetical protein [Portunus trituberculatus]
MSSSGDDDDCDQIKSSQLFNLPLQHHSADRETVLVSSDLDLVNGDCSSLLLFCRFMDESNV